jgi:hypothetical protein
MNAADVADGRGRSLVADAAQRREDLSGHVDRGLVVASGSPSGVMSERVLW